MSNVSDLEGIVTLSAPVGGGAGHFTLPSEFNQQLFAAHWALVGPAVESAKQLQPILGTNKAAQGWEVWKFPKGSKNAEKPHKVSVKNGEYVLMFRKKSIQNNVNAIYGNVSKRHLIREQRGESIGGAVIRDPGVLNNERIAKQYNIRDFGDEYEMNVPENPETSAPQVVAEPDATGQVPT